MLWLPGGGCLWFCMMISFMAVMGLQPALDCWGNRCRRTLCCPHQYPPVCVWPSRGSISCFSSEMLRFWFHCIIALIFVNHGRNVEMVKLEYEPQTNFRVRMHYLVGPWCECFLQQVASSYFLWVKCAITCSVLHLGLGTIFSTWRFSL